MQTLWRIIGTYNENASLCCIVRSCLVASERQFLDSRGIFVADDLGCLFGRYVEIMLADLCLRGRCVNRLGKFRAALKPCGLLDTVNSLSFLVPLQIRQTLIRETSVGEGKTLTLPTHCR